MICLKVPLFVHGSDGWFLSSPYARMGHGSEHPQSYALEVVGDIARA